MIQCRYTLEKHLEEYCRCDNSFSLLNDAYKFNKRQICEVLETIKIHFPHYSKHGVTHSMSIITSIELMLGEDRIKSLSASDTFLILLSAYLHDIGMFLSNKEIRQAWMTEEFERFLVDFAKENNEGKFLLDFIKNNYLSDKQQIIDLIGNTQTVISEYFRRDHAKRSEERILRNLRDLDIIVDNGKHIPMRIIKMLSTLCFAHAKSIEEVMTLEIEQSSSFGDVIHPRFIAIMLRIGDLLDLDNNRFDELAIKASYSGLNKESRIHYDKHNSVENFLITPEKICITAISDDINVLIEMRKWINYLEDEIENLARNWQYIIPKNFQGSAPYFRGYAKKVNSEEEFNTKSLKLEFPPKKAFELISGNNIYKDKFIFLREIIQNSLDAIRVQFWRDLVKGNIKINNSEDLNYSNIIPTMIEPDEFKKYNIKINFYEGYKDKEKIQEYIGNKNYEYILQKDNIEKSIVVILEDNGIGISIDDFKNRILNIGKKENSNNEYSEMPSWLKPTGGFGIGLHSIFVLTDKIIIQSKSELDKDYGRQIYIESGQKRGYVISDKWIHENEYNGKKVLRGTRIIICFDKSEGLFNIYNYKNLKQDRFNETSMDYIIKYMYSFIKKEIKLTYFPIIINDETWNEIPFYINSKNEEHNLLVKTYDSELYHTQLIHRKDSYPKIIYVYDKKDGNRLCLEPSVSFDDKYSISLTYKGIEIDDKELKDTVTDFVIMGDKISIDYSFEKTADYLNLNRDSFKREKNKEIIKVTKSLIDRAINDYNKFIIDNYSKNSSIELYSRLNVLMINIIQNCFNNMIDQKINEKLEINECLDLLLIELEKNKDKIYEIKLLGNNTSILYIVLVKRLFHWFHLLRNYGYRDCFYHDSDSIIRKFILKYNDFINNLFSHNTNEENLMQRYANELHSLSGGYSIDVLKHMFSYIRRKEYNILFDETNVLKIFLYNIKFGNPILFDNSYLNITSVLSDSYIHNYNYGNYSYGDDNDIRNPLMFIKYSNQNIRQAFFGSEVILENQKLYFSLENMNSSKERITSFKPIYLLDVILFNKERYYRYEILDQRLNLKSLGIKTTENAKWYLFSDLLKFDYIDIEERGWCTFDSEYYIMPALDEYSDIVIEDLPEDLRIIYNNYICSKINQGKYIILPLTCRDMDTLIEGIENIYRYLDNLPAERILQLRKGIIEYIKNDEEDINIEGLPEEAVRHIYSLFHSVDNITHSITYKNIINFTFNEVKKDKYNAEKLKTEIEDSFLKLVKDILFYLFKSIS